MAGHRGGLLLTLLLLLSLAVSELALGCSSSGRRWLPDLNATAISALSASLKPTETTALQPTTASTGTASAPPSSPETGASTPETPGTPPGSSSPSLPTVAPHTAAPAEPSTAPQDTTAPSHTSTGVPGSTPTPSQPLGTTDGTSPGTSTLTTGTTPDTQASPQSPGATTGTEPSSPATNSTQSPNNTSSTSTALPMAQPACPGIMSPVRESHIFLSMRLASPLGLGNTNVQDLIVSELQHRLQVRFPHANFTMQWRGKKP
ncbi:mucin-7-like isoform X2 [Cygnus olor]|uniref:mucin-7-like isoform X2 n=1 Tax=Cygnus olor TaxID=8869 RepID=UPI001ADEB1E9|nr:mucin-7-like isoform X2 [Cygnus olor]